MTGVQQKKRPGAVPVVRDRTGGRDGEDDDGSRGRVGGGPAARVGTVGARVVGVPPGRQRAAGADEQVRSYGMERARRGDGPQSAACLPGRGEGQPQNTVQVHPSPGPGRVQPRAAPREGALRQIRDGARHAG
ncbi:hypothetical protein SCYAM73S_06706 [Streptomyces cyaneofuscatus]